MRIDDDLDWYLDHVVVPDLAGAGPARLAAARWEQAAAHLARTPANDLARNQGFVLTRDQARTVGVADPEVRRHLRAGRWTSPRRGVLSVLCTGYSGHELDCAAAALVRPGTLVSHASAAVLRGLTVLTAPRRPVLTSSDPRAACGRHDVQVLASAIPDDAVDSWFGVPVTTVARTVVDVARWAGPGAGLVTADSALRERLTTLGELAATVERARGWRGSAAARRVVSLASPLSESALESLVRLFLHDHRLPLPELQVRIGRYRVDGLWRDRAVVLEVDGMLKYRGSPERLVAEKRRQEDLERAGYRVVRVTWDDIHHRPWETVARIVEALRLGGRRASRSH